MRVTTHARQRMRERLKIINSRAQDKLVKRAMRLGRRKQTSENLFVFYQGVVFCFNPSGEALKTIKFQK